MGSGVFDIVWPLAKALGLGRRVAGLASPPPIIGGGDAMRCGSYVEQIWTFDDRTQLRRARAPENPLILRVLAPRVVPPGGSGVSVSRRIKRR